jgi:hypothetical protein
MEANVGNESRGGASLLDPLCPSEGCRPRPDEDADIDRQSVLQEQLGSSHRYRRALRRFGLHMTDALTRRVASFQDIYCAGTVMITGEGEACAGRSELR